MPTKSRKGFGAMFPGMLGFTFFSASMWTGGTLGTGLRISEFLISVLLGNLILGGYTCLLAYIASSTGLSTYLLARYSFGEKGSYLVSFLLGTTQIGWFGHDDIFDPGYPLGTGNMLQVLHMGLHVCQMMGYSQINESIDFITNNSAKALNILDKYGIEEGKPANLIILPAENGYDAIRRQVPMFYSIRNGRVIVESQLSKTTLNIDGKNVEIDFKK